MLQDVNNPYDYQSITILRQIYELLKVHMEKYNLVEGFEKDAAGEPKATICRKSYQKSKHKPKPITNYSM